MGENKKAEKWMCKHEKKNQSINQWKFKNEKKNDSRISLTAIFGIKKYLSEIIIRNIHRRFGKGEKNVLNTFLLKENIE